MCSICSNQFVAKKDQLRAHGAVRGGCAGRGVTPVDLLPFVLGLVDVFDLVVVPWCTMITRSASPQISSTLVGERVVSTRQQSSRLVASVMASGTCSANWSQATANPTAQAHMSMRLLCMWPEQQEG